MAASKARKVEACPEDKQVIWFHGTSQENAETIQREGFKEGTWFAAHMEDAVEFGGPCIFFVKVSFSTVRAYAWQVCCSNPIPKSAIIKRFNFIALAETAEDTTSVEKGVMPNESGTTELSAIAGDASVKTRATSAQGEQDGSVPSGDINCGNDSRSTDLRNSSVRGEQAEVAGAVEQAEAAPTIESLRAHNQQLVTSVGRLRQELDSAKTDIDTLRTLSDLIRASECKYMKRWDESQAQVSALRRENAANLNLLNASVAMNMELRRENEALREKLEKLEAK